MFGKIRFSKLIGSLARHAATAIGIFLATRGVDSTTATEISGIVITIGSVVTSLIEKRESSTDAKGK
jgi:hypothetical protein